MDTFREIEDRIEKSENDGLIARWEFGRQLLALRDGQKQMPRGIIGQLAKDLGVHKSELNARMKFAGKFPTEDELSDAVRKFRTWHRITHEALRDNPRGERKAASPLGRVLPFIDELDPAAITPEECELLRRIGKAVARVLEGIDTLRQVA